MNITYDELKMNNYKLIDVRESKFYNMGHLNGSINIPVNNILYNINILDKNNSYVFICESGKTSLKLSKLLNNLGYKTYSLEGGYINLINKNF